ncbi:MAG: UDP-N-acetylmuramoyl-L-alanyl-D-glutamate--2,6-diaminopimelate ligase [Ignavibacteriaceae bacterium]|nr:UDP-N-acetylmuramoyl-L-alanyl-D-glutamate--2,6-diaminopimelate ligase [Ignavibacteriaceae bacterium]
MQLTDFLNGLRVLSVTGEVQRKDVSSIWYDSRKVQANSVFVAIKGESSDGHRHITEAISKGAIAVIVEDANAIPDEIYLHSKTAKIVVANSRYALADGANHLYKNPSERLALTGVTGTNGKTTVTYILKTIFEYAGKKTGLIGTIETFDGKKTWESQLTTPESSDLSRVLFDMAGNGCANAVMEVSSHALALERVSALVFRAAIFTNLSQDHLDYHQDMENYFRAKKKLFDMVPESGFVIYNADDEFGESIAADTAAMRFCYGKNPEADYRIDTVTCSLTGTKFVLSHRTESFVIETKLKGEFNAYNAAAAFTAAHLQGIKPEIIIEALKNIPQVPGRFEVFTGKGKTVIVDYAHTPDSLEKTLRNIHEIALGSEIYTVFGCGGNRDRGKRPLMGAIASQLSTRVILTNDNPRLEDPDVILAEIASGILSDNYKLIADRRLAIMSTISEAPEGSVILVAGKGHESTLTIGTEKIYFSDSEEVKKALGYV